MKWLISFFKLSLFKNINDGDVIWAKRYNNKNEKNKILEGHREGPYIVLQKYKHKLICIAGSGVKPIKHEDLYYKLNFLNYKTLKKDTYFKLNNIKIIKRNTFIKKIDYLNNIDKNKLFKKIINLSYRLTYPSKIINKINYELSKGDIISYQTKYYLILNVDTNYLCIKLNKKNYIKDNKIENIDFNNLCNINKNIKLEYLNSLDNMEFSLILEEYEKNKLIILNKNNIQRGSIIKLKDKYYYIFGSCKNEWLSYQIFLNKQSNYHLVKVKNMKIYTKFTEQKINKNSDLKLIYQFYSKEINILKSEKKKYQVVNKKSKKDNSIKIGNIIKLKTNDEEFVVEDTINDILVCHSLNNNKRSPKYYFKKDMVIKIK